MILKILRSCKCNAPTYSLFVVIGQRQKRKRRKTARTSKEIEKKI
jgi:hypothetical protein